MALDKQRILNELNSVVNQLQSADCGCMGSLFSTPNYNNRTMNNHMPASGGCGHGDSHACRHYCGAPHTKQPQTGMSMDPLNRHCMSRCNPQELYADTYKYLNGNLMQPVVQEVFNDLKSITPANTLSNNPMTTNMGLTKFSNNENSLIQHTPGSGTYNIPSEGFRGSKASPTVNNKYNYQAMGHSAGMGPQIFNMMMGDGSSNPGNVNEKNRQSAGPMVNDPTQSSVSYCNANQQQFDTKLNMNVSNGNRGQQHIYGDNNALNSMAQVHPVVRSAVQSNVTNFQPMNNVNTNPTAQQLSAAHRHSHGQHAQGVEKFNHMFPGVMQGIGGDLSFDPMSIAIQMNPANQQKVAINTMQKIMNSKPLHNAVDATSHSGTMQPTVPGANAAITSIVQGQINQAKSNSTTLGQTSVPGQAQDSEKHLSNTVPNNFLYNSQQREKVYTTMDSHNNESIYRPSSQLIQYPQTLQQMGDLNNGAVISPSTLPTVYEGNYEPNNLTAESALPQLADKRQVKEAIFPVDTSRNLTSGIKQDNYNEYNTLGQPIELLPAKIYHTPESKLPQPLAPQPVFEKNDPMKYTNVKSTVSKTSLIQKTPVSKTSSRSQLQQIQYKGSQSYTHQNIKGSGYDASQSEGNLKVFPVNSVNQALIEKAGDTAVQNPTSNHEIPNGIVHDHNSDMSVNKPIEDHTQKTLSTKQTTCRNGLQDITYTSYPTSTAWSFHGQNPGYKKFRA